MRTFCKLIFLHLKDSNSNLCSIKYQQSHLKSSFRKIYGRYNDLLSKYNLWLSRLLTKVLYTNCYTIINHLTVYGLFFFYDYDKVRETWNKSFEQQVQSGITDKYQLNNTSLCKYKMEQKQGYNPSGDSCGPEKLHGHLDDQIIKSGDQMVYTGKYKNFSITS